MAQVALELVALFAVALVAVALFAVYRLCALFRGSKMNSTMTMIVISVLQGKTL